MLEIIIHCGALAILGVGFTLWAMWASLQVTSILSLSAGGLGSALCGSICGGIAIFTTATYLLTIINGFFGKITDEMVADCKK